MRKTGSAETWATRGGFQWRCDEAGVDRVALITVEMAPGTSAFAPRPLRNRYSSVLCLSVTSQSRRAGYFIFGTCNIHTKGLASLSVEPQRFNVNNCPHVTGPFEAHSINPSTSPRTTSSCHPTASTRACRNPCLPASFLCVQIVLWQSSTPLFDWPSRITSPRPGPRYMA